MNIRESVYGMHKQADVVSQVLGDATSVARDIGVTGCVYLLALTAASGVGLGYAGAKMTAHGHHDIDTVKKEYENERLKADLGYLNGRVRGEYAAYKNRVAPKPARVIA